MKVVILGAGYVGLVSGACFAEFGVEVTCVDKDPAKIDQLQRGEIPIYEPGLQALVKTNREQGRLRFTTEFPDSVARADIVFIAVGTPTRHGDGHADLQYVYAAAKELASCLSGYTIVVNKSTVPVGTASEVQRIIRKANPDADFDMASNPEFLREGSAIGDFMRPDRVIIGVDSERAEQRLRELYRPLNLRETPIVITGLESAELAKYAANAFLATKISFINEISQLCERTGANVHEVAKGMGLDRRIGSKFLHPGPGYGGSCFPKDTLAMIRMAQEHGVSSRIVEAVVEVNAAQKARMITKIRDALGGSEADKTIAILGLTFKPETDDMREAPALAILPMLVERGATIRAHDPVGMDEARRLLPDGIEYSNSVEEAVDGADALVLLTEWNQYRGLSLSGLKQRMQGNAFVDLRNVYERARVEDHGFSYFGVGL